LNKVKKAKNFTDQERNRYQINSVMNIEMWNND
jgi:KaiC/GvpD/RAD55 family RecA-like ATPase